MTLTVAIRCDACAAVVQPQDVRQLTVQGRRYVDACSEACEAVLRKRYAIAAKAGA